MVNYQLGPVTGKFGGGSDIQVHPVEVEYREYGQYSDREVLKVPGEPGSQYLITIEGHYENDDGMESYQLRWRTESSDWVRIDREERGGRTQVAVPAQGGDTLTVGFGSSYSQQDASFIGKAYVVPVPEIGEGEGSTTTFPVGPMTVSGTRNTEHLVADLEIPPGEVWRVKVTGTFTWDTNRVFMDVDRSPRIVIGAKDSGYSRANETIEIEAYVSTVGRISIITNHKDEAEFVGTVEITPMNW